MKIRRAVFETNSSSTHSISVASADADMMMDTIRIPESGVLELGTGEYGWEWEKYNDALTKADYCAVYCRDAPKLREMLSDVLQKQTGAQAVVFADTEGLDSYIDHQSDIGDGQAAQEAFKDSETLRNFIFNKNSWLFLGNDNSEAPNGFYDAPDTSYSYGLVIEGFPNETWKFKEKPAVSDVVEAIKSKFGHSSRVLARDRSHFFEPMIYPHLAFEFKLDYKDPSGNFGINFHGGDLIRGWFTMVNEDRYGREIETIAINFSVEEL
jgi:hypothetical protein